MKTIQICTFVAVTCALLLINVSVSKSADNCAELLNNKCTECHNLERICRKIGRKDEKRWTRMIKRMLKNGAKLSDSEKIEMLNCLVDQTLSTIQLCKQGN